MKNAKLIADPRFSITFMNSPRVRQETGGHPGGFVRSISAAIASLSGPGE